MLQLKKILQAALSILQANTVGWLRIGLMIGKTLLSAMARQGLYRPIYLAACSAMIISSLLPWIEYQIAYLPDKQQTNSALTLAFFSAGLLGAFLGFFPYRKLIALLLFLSITTLYSTATFYAGHLHTAIAEKEYNLTATAYIYGAALIVALLFYTKALSYPWIKREELQRWLFEVPKGNELPAETKIKERQSKTEQADRKEGESKAAKRDNR